jgi:hypothetical protein
MGSSAFAAAVRPRQRSDDGFDESLIHEILGGDNLQNPHISEDVRTLVDLHDHGRLPPFETKGPAYKVLLGLAEYLRKVLGTHRRTGLLPETLVQAVKFVRSVPAESVFIRFEVTDKKPQMPNFNPAHLCAYDVDRKYGSDFLQIARRLTIFGSTSTVMSNTDLGSFLESGKKKCAFLYLGTHKTDDARFLEPASQMALDLVLTGLERGESAETIETKTQILASHPEIAEIHSEAADLKILLVDFRNDLLPEKGQELLKRLDVLSQRIESLSETLEFLELLSPLEDRVREISADEMVHEIISMNAEKDFQEPQTEIDALEAKVHEILDNPDLLQSEKISAVMEILKERVPSLLEDSQTALKTMDYLTHLQQEMAQSGSLLKEILIQEPKEWGETETRKLIALVRELDNPETILLLKQQIGQTPEGEKIIESLERLQATARESGENPEILIQRIGESLKTPTPENAILAADTLRVLGFAALSDTSALSSPSLQVVLNEFTRETLKAQIGLAEGNLPQRVSEVLGSEAKIIFNPLSLSFDATSPSSVMDAIRREGGLTSLSVVLDSLKNPDVREKLLSNPQTAELVRALDALPPIEGHSGLTKILASADPEVQRQLQRVLELSGSVATLPPESLASLPSSAQTALLALSSEGKIASLSAALDSLKNPDVREKLLSNPQTAELVRALDELPRIEGQSGLTKILASADPEVQRQLQRVLELSGSVATLPPESLASLPSSAQTGLLALSSEGKIASLSAALDSLKNPDVREKLLSNPQTAELVRALDALPPIEGHSGLTKILASADPEVQRQLQRVLELSGSVATLPPESLASLPSSAQTGLLALSSEGKIASLSAALDSLKNPDVREKLLSNPQTAELVRALDELPRIEGQSGLTKILASGDPEVQRQLQRVLELSGSVATLPKTKESGGFNARETKTGNKPTSDNPPPPPPRFPEPIVVPQTPLPIETKTRNTPASDDPPPRPSRFPEPIVVPQTPPPIETKTGDKPTSDNPPPRPSRFPEPIVVPQTPPPIETKTGDKPTSDNPPPPPPTFPEPMVVPQNDPPSRVEPDIPCVCPVTGGTRCLCDSFAQASENRDALDLGNGTSAGVQKGEDGENRLVITNENNNVVLSLTESELRAEQLKHEQRYEEIIKEQNGGKAIPSLSEKIKTENAALLRALKAPEKNPSGKGLTETFTKTCTGGADCDCGANHGDEASPREKREKKEAKFSVGTRGFENINLDNIKITDFNFT